MSKLRKQDSAKHDFDPFETTTAARDFDPFER